MRSERAAHVRIRDDEPQHDGQVERDEDLGVRVRVVRVDVDHERGEHERHRREHPSPGVELPSAREVRGEKRQHEQRGITRQPGWLVIVGKAGSEACELDRDGRSHGEGEGLDPAGRHARRLVVGSQELLPEPAAVLARELPGESVEVPHPFHGDQESLIAVRPAAVSSEIWCRR